VTIETLRARIDAMDEQLVTLLNIRATCAIEIGRIKRRTAIPVNQPEREAEIGRHVRSVSARLGGPFSGEAVARLFERILDEDRQLEASLDGDGDVAPHRAAGHTRPE
jgi:chorismate mutase